MGYTRCVVPEGNASPGDVPPGCELVPVRTVADALDQLIPIVYDELRRLAAHKMAQEKAGHTLQPTALVNEAYLKVLERLGRDAR